MNVTVFGGSNPNEEDYRQAKLLGYLLGEAGHTVLTGGYIGAMEAVSKGAAEAKAHVVGVTCAEIETWRPVKPNQWIAEERRFATLRERLFALIEGCDAAIALPGGPGTLTEIALTWNLLLTETIPPRPLILVGPGWRMLFEQFYAANSSYISEPQRRWLSFARNAEEACNRLSI
jgi:hypothetical protein